GGELRPGTDDLHGDIGDVVTRLADPAGGLGQQCEAARACPVRVAGVEVAPEVAEAGRGQQGVRGRVARDVAIGVPAGGRLTGGLYAREDQPERAVGGERVTVLADDRSGGQVGTQP